jgi:hypothetical protein
MTDLQAKSGALIDARRRTPSHCLYCTEHALTQEHIVPEAIGGRLTAYLLCAKHNGIANIGADEPLSKNFAPFINMLQTPRHRGGVGAEFIGLGANGNPVTIVPEGFAKQLPLVVKKRDAQRRIARVEGDLMHLDDLPTEAFSEGARRVILAKIYNPDVDFAVASDEKIRPGLFKIAVHFFAGFISDIKPEIAQELLQYVSGEQAPTGDMVRTPFLDEDVFPDSWPARHEITCYPDGDHALVTILLLSAYAYSCRLPVRMPGQSGIRYIQVLTANYPQFLDDIPIPPNLDWERRPGPDDQEAWSARMEPRIRRIYEHGIESSIRSRCRRAFERAIAESSNLGDLWERYRAALQFECFSATDIDVIVAIGRKLRREDQDPWEVPVAIEDPT